MSTQATLFDDIPKPHRRRPRSTQAEHIERVTSAIAASVLDFCRARVGREFHADELRRFVVERHPSAPGSADRILRDLKAKGRLSYIVVNRRASLYALTRCA